MKPQPKPRETPSAPEAEILRRIFDFAPDGILLVGAGGRIARANAQAERMFGYAPGAMSALQVEDLVPARLAERHLAHRTSYVGQPHARPMGVGLDLFARRSDGTEFPVDIMLSPVEHEGGALVLAVVRDVTERRRIEEEARRAREMYLRELHHRVKNNLQVISSLLYLQATKRATPPPWPPSPKASRA